jgi:hypothetical protein
LTVPNVSFSIESNLLHIRLFFAASPGHRAGLGLAKPAERITQSGGLVKSSRLDRPSLDTLIFFQD